VAARASKFFIEPFLWMGGRKTVVDGCALVGIVTTQALPAPFAYRQFRFLA
jgi:hypothetical protein